jgi:acyl-CoA synthetase (NDP forming)
MLEARSVALVGASARSGSLGERALTELERSPSKPEIHLVNPRYTAEGIGGRHCAASLDDIEGEVDLVLLAVGDHALEEQLTRAAGRGDRSAVIFASAFHPTDTAAFRGRLAATARRAGMALCGGGCMGFVNVAGGLRVLGFLEPDPLPEGPVALVTHSGSAFSALLRADRRLGWTLAVSSGQELVTTTADYLDYALTLPSTGAIALLLETPRNPPHLIAALQRAAALGIPVVALTVGGSPAGRALVTAHSGALAGEDATWEALCEATGVVRVRDLAEMADCLELYCAGRKVVAPGLGLATVHDSGAERTLTADVAADLGVGFAEIGDDTRLRLGEILDPGLEPANPLDVWGRGADTRRLFAGALSAMADDPAVGVVALAVDLVAELDGDEAYRDAAADALLTTEKPLAVIANLPASIDRAAAGRLRAEGIPVLEGTRSGLVALKALLGEPERLARAARREPVEVDPEREARWRKRLAPGTPGLSAAEAAALLAEYELPAAEVLAAGTRQEAVEMAERIGYPCVLKSDAPGLSHKSDAGGVVLGLSSSGEVATAYDEMAERLGPGVSLSPMVGAGVEIALGITRDPLLGPLVVVGAGGVLTEVMADRRVALPPISSERAERLLDGLRIRPLLDGFRGAPAADLGSVVRAIQAISQIASELGPVLEALDVNPLVCRPEGAVAVDALVVAGRAPTETGASQCTA